MVVCESSPKFSSPPFCSSPRSSYFYSLLPTCSGVSFAVASSHQLHFQCLEVPTYVLNACVCVGFQVPTTLMLVHCWQELHEFMILHHDEHTLKFFTFASTMIARECKFKYFCRFLFIYLFLFVFYSFSNLRVSCEYFMCAYILGDFVQFYTITKVSMTTC
jgi:hypothetical protein